jgi:aspartate/methionine/tyrosine aminotransferase
MNIPPFQLERYFAKYEFNVEHLLCASDCESFTVADILKLEPGAENKLLKLNLCYGDSRGSLELREEITALYETMDSNEILVHSGAGEAIYTFMASTLSPGDHIIVQAPHYQSLSEVARSLGCEISNWEMRETESWSLDLDFLRKTISKKTKAVVVNSPHNPTGYLMSWETQTELVEICRNAGVFLFSDEVYRELEYQSRHTLPAACDLYENAISLGVLSKSLGLPGLRIGWIATKNREALEKIAAFKDYTTICNSSPSETLATVALRHRKTLLQRNQGIISENFALVESFLKRFPTTFQWIAPKAGCLGFPRYKGSEGARDFCSKLLSKTGALLLPSHLYNYGDSHFRIGYGRKDFGSGLKKVEEFLLAREV